MKPKRFILLLSLALLSYWGYTQAEGTGVDILEFYKQMAISDAEVEETLVFASIEDEADYWTDQHNFEKRLKELEYSAYKTYIFYKRKAYLEHQLHCDISANHGMGYNGQASFYGAHGNLRESGGDDISGNHNPTPVGVSQRH